MKRFFPLLLLLGVAAFVFGLVRLFNLRCQAGDVYPPYSSFRADPLGTKALYESLRRLVDTSRHLQRWTRLDGPPGSTLLFLGVNPEHLQFRKDEIQALENFVGNGGRLIISFLPRYRYRVPLKPGEENLIKAKSRWDFDYGYALLPKGPDGSYLHPSAGLASDSPLPPELSWHSAIYFTNLPPAWSAIYAISNDLPVMIERRLGDGTIVLSSDSYFLSNEALMTERHTPLLTWIVGPARRVVFDETHLGVREEPGLASLARRYRLHGLAAGLLLLALLFIWRSAASFVPAPEIAGASQTIAGKEAAEGFVNLLRRNILPDELAAVCIAEWKRACARRIPPARLQQVQAVIDQENQLSSGRRDPLLIYRALARVLKTPRASAPPGARGAPEP